MTQEERVLKAKLYRMKELIAGAMLMVDEGMVTPMQVPSLMIRKTQEIWADNGDSSTSDD